MIVSVRSLKTHIAQLLHEVALVAANVS